ncbi:N-acetylglucosamine-6-phosphate deacetylase [Sedimentimonas flavescens]|uniref:N-acetylglucosamine-6-phosphate deacetylase n=1 Tax=Sedimentimonas flavescens TaxID=2851012 RepID=UPI0021A3FA1D|nr:N-acetylglucosamine-6-phosphate deacetylase [Sedimentimonas flavescens]MCT2539467.1 N-acetylglucosamine-6-phosphate deacetylase [Sedimentimonas flavescens]WBL32716.1 N-acetylglucosamine-6-phosphate deacetylase [Sinirhodobacter sp. HNIBRBA609]
MADLILTGAKIFDGESWHENHALVLRQGKIATLVSEDMAPDGPREQISGTLAPGLIDLQLNGGGGVMLDGAASVQSIATICEAHARLGATGILPTLITDSAAATQTVLAAAIAAVPRVPGFLGLHLEGPHLDPRRPGCHPRQHIRPMTEEDIEVLLEAVTGLPALMITLAPAAVTPEQIARLVGNGIIVSLGHSDCTYDEARAAIDAGASVVTHLFNAMSQLGSREPGLVGAALDLPVDVGLIADGIHVHPATLRMALAAKRHGRMFLVSDAMAAAGTDLAEFDLAGQRILRREGALRLENGTLAGADLSLPQAIRTLITQAGVPAGQAIAMASAIPASVIGARAGRIAPGLPADLVLFDDDWNLTRVWRAGKALQANSSTA